MVPFKKMYPSPPSVVGKGQAHQDPPCEAVKLWAVRSEPFGQLQRCKNGYDCAKQHMQKDAEIR